MLVLIGDDSKTATRPSVRRKNQVILEEAIMAYPPVIACLRLALNVGFKACLTGDCGSICKRAREDSASWYALR